MTEKCPKCNHPLQQAMFNIFDTDKAHNGNQLVCINPDCPIGKYNAPQNNMDDGEE